MELFLNLLDLFYISIWSRAFREHWDRGRAFKTNMDETEDWEMLPAAPGGK